MKFEDSEKEWSFPLEEANPKGRSLNVLIYSDAGDYPGVAFEVEGLRHPLLERHNVYQSYIGEETKNPQLRYAIEILENIFKQWIEGLPLPIQQALSSTALTVREFHNSGQNKKMAYILGRFHLSEPMRDHLLRAAPSLEQSVEQNADRIKAAIVKGQREIALTDPKAAIERGFFNALASISSHPNVDANSAINSFNPKAGALEDLHSLSSPDNTKN